MLGITTSGISTNNVNLFHELKNNNIQYNTKINRKVLDLIEKYLVKNKVWIKTKGLLVEQKEVNTENVESDSKSKILQEEMTDEFNPFS